MNHHDVEISTEVCLVQREQMRDAVYTHGSDQAGVVNLNTGNTVNDD